MERRLAAILAADVVGYSRLIRADEEGTLTALKALRENVIDPRIREHNGRIVKLMGDGVLIEFLSVVDAVRAAIATQLALAEHNARVPEDRRLEFRVGVNLGDVVIDGDDIHGDGVNVAARLEGLAEPGGISISEKVHDEVRDRFDWAFADMGEQRVKNIDRPIRVWRWLPSDVAADAVAGSEKPAVAPDKLSIAVLPFDNMSGDPEQEFFADGICEDIITALSKVSRMRVIARNSSFAYKGTTPNIRTVAEELGVRYVLEGSVRRGGKRIRVTAQLIDATDGSHVWAERYDRVVDDLFDIQDEITKEIVTNLRVKLTDGEEMLVWARGTKNVEAWQYGVRASELFIRFNGSDHLEARKLAERAVALDPDYAHAWATLGFTYWFEGRLGFGPDVDAKFEKARELADRAMAIDDTASWAIGLSALVAAAQDRHDEGVAIAERGVEYHPGNADVRAFLAFALAHAGRYEEAVQHMRAAMALNPFAPEWYRNGLCRSLIFLDRLEEALPICDEILASEPRFQQAWIYRAYLLEQLGRHDEAQEAVRETMRLTPMFRVGHVHRLFLHHDEAGLRRIAGGLRAAGLPD